MILLSYLRGKCSNEEAKQVENWCEEAQENREVLEQLYYTLFVGDRIAVMNAVDTEMSLDKLKSKIRDKEKIETRKKLVGRWRRYTTMAAAFLAGLVFAGGVTWGLLANKLSDYEVITAAGQRAQITLADGTKVWLNSQSTLTYASNFGRQERNVLLDGEAYFEVSKNEKIPFFVNTETNKVRVVGTSFNVCAYNGSNEFETTLVTGIVDIYTLKGEKPITRLEKGEFFGLYNGKAQKKILPSYDYLRWKEGLYCFDDSPLSCMFSKLEKYYNVKITVNNPKLLDYHCTGKFKEQDGIEHILRVIQKDHKFTYHINEERDSIAIE